MSNWFQNVGSLLEKLDDQAEKVSEERAIAQDEEAGLGGHAAADAAIDDILNKRGLSSTIDNTDLKDGSGEAGKNQETGKGEGVSLPEGVMTSEQGESSVSSSPSLSSSSPVPKISPRIFSHVSSCSK